MTRFLGFFVRDLKESYEMLYQFESDYIFNSDKFEKEFNFTPTPYDKGMNEIIHSDFCCRNYN
jgi:hypothetical protein